MFGEVNGSEADAQGFGHVASRPFFEDVEVEDLELSGAELGTDFFESGFEEAGAPFFVPKAFEVLGGGGSFDGGGLVVVVWVGGLDALIPAMAFGELVFNAPGGEVEKPGFEAAFGGVVMEFADVFGEADASFLDDFVGLGFVEAGFEGETADDWAVDAMELMPTILVAGLQSLQEAGAGVDGLALWGWHLFAHATALTSGSERSFRKSEFSSLREVRDARFQRLQATNSCAQIGGNTRSSAQPSLPMFFSKVKIV